MIYRFDNIHLNMSSEIGATMFTSSQQPAPDRYR